MKDNVFKTIIIPAMTYRSKCWVVKKKHENKLHSAEITMLIWAKGKIRLDHIRNEDIRKDAHLKPIETLLENKRLKSFGHCLRGEHSYMCTTSLKRAVSESRRRA